ncbi:MAG TPA: hypothetical protein VFZ78_03700, partial [Flavisolibacter sp.]
MLKKSIIAFSFIACIALLISFRGINSGKQVVRTVIIDAGHGIMANGGYNGAKGRYSHEDDIALSVSK